MASSEVDQKFLGNIAKSVEPDNPLLAQMLFKILGLSINLSQQLVKAQKQRKLDTSRETRSLDLYFHILWLAREGLLMLEQYVLPMVGNHVVLKVLAYKLRASFLHIYVLFHNQPPVSALQGSTPEAATAATIPPLQPPQPPPSDPPRLDKGKGVARDDDDEEGYYDEAALAAGRANASSVQPTHALEGGPVGPPPGLGHPMPPHAPPAAFLLPVRDYLPIAHQYFREAVALADHSLWGSHSLLLSVKTEYAAFLYECVHDGPGSRKLASDTIHAVYNATEGVDDDMFNDACELVTVLGKMVKRGLGPTSTTSNTALRGTTTTTSAGAGTGGAGGAGGGDDGDNKNGSAAAGPSGSTTTTTTAATGRPLLAPTMATHATQTTPTPTATRAATTTTTTTTSTTAASSAAVAPAATSRVGGRGEARSRIPVSTNGASAPPLTAPPSSAPPSTTIGQPPLRGGGDMADFI